MRPNCVEMNLKLMAFEQLCRGPYLLRGLFPEVVGVVWTAFAVS